MKDKEEFEPQAAAEGQENTSFEIHLAKASTGVVSHPKITAHTQSEEADVFEDEGPSGQLTIDVYQTPTHIVIESAVAGVSEDDLNIDVSSDSISIKGQRRRENKVRDEDYLYQECYWGKFSRSVILPQEIDPDSAAASFKNGILTIKLPKVNKQKIKKLKVRFE